MVPDDAIRVFRRVAEAVEAVIVAGAVVEDGVARPVAARFGVEEEVDEAGEALAAFGTGSPAVIEVGDRVAGQGGTGGHIAC